MRFLRSRQIKNELSSIDDWYRTPLGQYLFDELREKLNPVLLTSFGYYSMQIGCSGQSKSLLESCRIKHNFNIDKAGVDVSATADPALLPVATDSVDLVVLMHHLSNTKEPHAILRESFRVLIPEGKLIIIEFNPVSFWGLRHFFQGWLEQAPWSGHYYTASRLKDWLKLLGFDQQNHYRVGYMPPIQHLSLTSRLSWLEKGLRNWFGFSAALNVLVCEKSISPLTPVRFRWVTRKLLPARISRPSVGRGMKYDK